MTDWKDDYREHKDEVGITWAEYHDRYFVHVSELDDATDTLESLRDEVADLRAETRDLKRELHEIKVLAKSEEFEVPE